MKSRITQHFLFAALVIAAALGPNATAAPVPVVNPSFETNQLFGGTSPTNWNAKGNGGVSIQSVTNGWFTPTGTGTLSAPADGTNFLVININGNPGWVYEDVGPLQPNTAYTLTISIGESLLGNFGAGRIALINGSNPFQTVLAQTHIDTTTFVAGTFQDATVVYDSGYQVSGDLTVLMQGDSGAQIIFDNVRLAATALPQSPTATPVLLSTTTNTVYQGTLVTLSELPAGVAPFHYQWQSDNGSGGATFTAITGANNPAYVVDTSGFTPNSPVEYRVVVTNSLGAATSAPVALTAVQGPPVITRDTLPTVAYTVLGDSITFTVSADGSRPLTYQWRVDFGIGPVDVPNATNATLTLPNLQYTDAGSYSVQVKNTLGSVISTPAVLSLDPLPMDVGGIVISPASQLGFVGNNTFVPTWVLATNSLIAGKAPTNSVGNFSLEGAGGIPVLTDGQFGTLPPEGTAGLGLATCGVLSSGAGASIAYALPASSNGYDLTNVVVYGGWSDAGRDQQQYNLYYSTVANPTNFNNLIAYVNFEPTNTANAQSATRITITSTNGIVARNVAAIMFDFNVLVAATENGYTGYAEFQVFGTPSAPKPVLSLDTQPATGSDVEGSQITFVAAFASSTPISYQWQVDKGAGPVNIPGATSPTLTLKNLQLSDTGSYSLKASNASGTSVSRASSFVVNPLPPPDGYGVIVSPANQTGTGTRFTPTWAFPSGSLIANTPPSAKGPGTFSLEGAGGPFVLTDGQFGFVGSGNNSTLCTCGSGVGGHSLTYTLTGSQSGYDLTNISVYAGWSDGGRDQQAYSVYYSTVSAPTTFTLLSSASYNPQLPGAVPSTDRVTFTSGTSTPLATGVARIMFDFTSPAGENGYSGYAEIAVFGSRSAPTTLPPTVLTDTVPATGSDVVGSQVTFVTGFDSSAPISYQWQKDTGTGPVNIPGATNATLTLTNLQLSDTALYSLVASNGLGVATNTPANFTVNPLPAPSGGLIIATANQTSFGNTFTPTWTIEPGSLIAGAAPSSFGGGSFVIEASGGIPVLTDGMFGWAGVGSYSFASCGVGAGSNLTYTLPASPAGQTLTKIVTYGGWADSGRDQQHYTVYYSTVANPTNFVQLGSVSYNPSIATGVPSADRVTITPASAASLAQNVAAVKFDFTNPTGENGWSGYAELSVFGAPLPPAVSSITVSGGKLIVTGAGGSPGAGYTWLTATNVASPIATWTVLTNGVFSGQGTFSNAIPITVSEPSRFFQLRTP